MKELLVGDIPDVDLGAVGTTTFGDFSVEVIDPVKDYASLFEEVFDFGLIRGLLSRRDFAITFDALHAITGVYAKPILCDLLGAPESALMNCVPLEDFGGGHPDPNLTYAKSLVDKARPKMRWRKKRLGGSFSQGSLCFDHIDFS